MSKKNFIFVFHFWNKSKNAMEDSHNWYCSGLENRRLHSCGGSSPSSSAQHLFFFSFYTSVTSGLCLGVFLIVLICVIILKSSTH